MICTRNVKKYLSNSELNLEAKCICRCHEENKIKVVPDSVRAREHVASVSQKQTTLDEIGVANATKRRDNK